MLKRTLVDKFDQSYRDMEPQVKRPNLSSPVPTGNSTRGVSPCEDTIKTLSMIKNVSNDQNSMESTLSVVALHDETPTDNSNSSVNALNTFFNKKPVGGTNIIVRPPAKRLDADKSRKNLGGPNIFVCIPTKRLDADKSQQNLGRPIIIRPESPFERLDADKTPGPQSSTTNSITAQLPKMIVNPKAVNNIMKNPPDVIPKNDQIVRHSAGTKEHESSNAIPSIISPNESNAINAIEKKPIAFKRVGHKFVPAGFPPNPCFAKQQPECCVIEKLVKRFLKVSVRPLPEKDVLMYFRSDRPTPAIPTLAITEGLYKYHTWITGCPTMEGLFCWVCLLFTQRASRNQSPIWVKEGFRDMHILGNAMSNHLRSVSHLNALEIKDRMIKKHLAGKLDRGLSQTQPAAKPPNQANINQNARSKYVQEVAANTVSFFDIAEKGPQASSRGDGPSTGTNCLLGEPKVSKAIKRQRYISGLSDQTSHPQSDNPQQTSPGGSKGPKGSSSTNAVNHGQYRKLVEELKTTKLPCKLPVTQPQIKPTTWTNSQPLVPISEPKSHVLHQMSIVSLKTLYFRKGTFKGTEEQREQMIANGRPTPKMLCLFDQSDGGIIYFNDSYYTEFPWLSGSPELRRLYCWPCFVFSDSLVSENIWAGAGVTHMIGLKSAARGHAMNHSHIDLAIRLKIYERNIKIKTQPIKTNPAEYNEIVCQKRSLLKYLIDAVCFKKKLLNNSESCPEDFKDYLKVLSTWDVQLKNLLEPKSANCESEINPFHTHFVQNYSLETTKAVTIALKRKIAKEVENAVYVSFFLKTVQNGRTALILRYCESTGEVHERFYKFIKVGFGLEESLVKIIVAEVSYLKCSNKFVGISYDGGVLLPEQMEPFNSGLRKELPAAYFFHYRDDNFKALLQQSLSHNPCCRSFSSLVESFGKFLEDNPLVLHHIKKIEDEMPQKKGKNWDLKSGIVLTIRNHYSAIIKFLDEVVKQSPASEHAWTNIIISQCAKFSMFLSLRETRFFLVLFSTMYLGFHPLIEAVQGEFDAKYWKTASQEASGVVVDIKVYQFGEICKEAEKMIGREDLSMSIQDRTTLLTMFNKVLDWVLAFIENRTKYIDVWAYFGLSIGKDDNLAARANDSLKYNRQFFTHLKECFPFLDHKKLGAELIFAHSHERFRHKSPAEIIQFMVEWDVKSILPELYNFLLLIQTVPQTSAHVSNPVSNKIVTYVEGKTNLKSADARFYVEKDLLAALKKEAGFYDDVIRIISELKRTNEFTEVDQYGKSVEQCENMNSEDEVVQID